MQKKWFYSVVLNTVKSHVCTLFFCSDMSQDSQHGKWTISSSEDEDNALPPSGTTTSMPHKPTNIPRQCASPTSLKLEPVSATEEVKPETVQPPVSSLVIGSEARQSAAKNQLNPVKYETSPSLAGKRKKDVTESSGWAVSDSDDDDSAMEKKKLPPKPTSPKTKKTKVEKERPPSPHGRSYYIDESEDFFESSIPCGNDMYRFYLNKVTGLDRKYNTGALHIRGKRHKPEQD